jgi:hypothetical protein
MATPTAEPGPSGAVSAPCGAIPISLVGQAGHVVDQAKPSVAGQPGISRYQLASWALIRAAAVD